MFTTFNLKVEINGEELHSTFAGFKLIQSYNSHHRFELKILLQYIEGGDNENLEKSKSFIGQSVKFKISEADANQNATRALNEFSGVITGIALHRYDGASSFLLISGFSPSVLLDHGYNTKTYYNLPLSGLVQSITGKYPFGSVRFNVQVSPDPSLNYTHQHQESNFHFLCRLADRYGQWFFYDGSDFLFGKLSAGDTVKLTYGYDLSAFKLGVMLMPTKFKTTAIDGQGKAQQVFAAQIDGLSQLSKFAFDESNKYFFDEQVFNTDLNIGSVSELQDIAKSRRAAIAANLVKLTGDSINARLKPGGKISVMADSTTDKSTTDYGTFTVIAVTHYMDGMGDYRNSFEAIPSSLNVPPAIGETYGMTSVSSM